MKNTYTVSDGLVYVECTASDYDYGYDGVVVFDDDALEFLEEIPGSLTLSSAGYCVYARHGVPGGTEQCHRKLLEWYGETLEDGYVVHHINGNKLDNRRANLHYMEQGQHTKLHVARGWVTFAECDCYPELDAITEPECLRESEHDAVGCSELMYGAYLGGCTPQAADW